MTWFMMRTKKVLQICFYTSSVVRKYTYQEQMFVSGVVRSGGRLRVCLYPFGAEELADLIFFLFRKRSEIILIIELVLILISKS